MRFEIKTWLCVVLALHIGVVGISLHALNAAAAYWSNFLVSGAFHPRLLPFVIASSRWFPWMALAVVVVGVACLWKPHERHTLRVMMMISLLTLFIVSLTTLAMAQPLAVAARLMNKQTANQASQAIGAPGAPQPER